MSTELTETTKMYIGTYTDSGSKGIYSFDLDLSTGYAKLTGTNDELANPSYLVVSKSGDFLYSVSETDYFEGQSGGSVAIYSINQKSGELNLLDSAPTLGTYPCHLCVSSAKDMIFVANYGSGSISTFNTQRDKLVSNIPLIKHQGSSLNPLRQEGPHTHFVYLSPDEKNLFAVDLGIDKVMIYELDEKNNCIKSSKVNSILTNPGSGPRHLVFAKDFNFLYIINELDSTIQVFEASLSDLAFRCIQTISTLPDEFKDNSTCAAVRISKDGRFLYASNRGHDSIAVYSINLSNGLLSHIQFCPTNGKTPRDINIDPSGKYLFSANQDSGTVVSFKINSKTGQLEPTGFTLEIPSPCCVEFVNLKPY